MQCSSRGMNYFSSHKIIVIRHKQKESVLKKGISLNFKLTYKKHCFESQSDPVWLQNGSNKKLAWANSDLMLPNMTITQFIKLYDIV